MQCRRVIFERICIYFFNSIIEIFILELGYTLWGFRLSFLLCYEGTTRDGWKSEIGSLVDVHTDEQPQRQAVQPYGP